MKITCENCNTRFLLKAIRLPPQGARVRCSRCQHRFHVKPDPETPTPDPPAETAVEDSAAPAPAAEQRDSSAAPVPPPAAEPAPAAERRAPDPPRQAEAPEPAPRSPREEPSLDDPQFLFEPSARAEEPAPEAPADPPPPSPDPVLGDPGEAAETDRDFTSPSAPAAAQGQPLDDPDDDDTRSSLFGEAPVGGFSAADFETEVAGSPPDPPPQLDAAPPVPEPLGDIGGAEPVEPTALFGDSPLSSDESQDELDSWRGFAQENLSPESASSPSSPRAVQTPSAPVVPSTAVEPSRSALPGLLARLAALAVGIALVGGGLRAFPVVSGGVGSGPLQLHGAGWRADRIEAFHTRDGRGRRVLVIRGSLRTDATREPPLVQAQLLDRRGERLGAPASAHLVRLEGAQLEPRKLRRWVESSPVAPSRGYRITGFTVLYAEPPPEAERFRLELLPRTPASGNAEARDRGAGVRRATAARR